MREFKQIASWRHLALVVAIMLATAVRGMMFHSRETAPAANHSVVYVGLILIESALVYLVWRGIRTTGTTLRDLVGGRWQSARDAARDVGLAFVLWVVLIGVVNFWKHVIGGGGLPSSVAAMLPHSPVERILWIFLSIVAGISEELLFRGYCQRQFEALTGNTWIALSLQAILFGVSHGYQGIDAMMRITLLGLAFGLMAIWRRSLRPGILAHAWTDIASGMIGAR